MCEVIGLPHPCKEYLNRQEVAEAVMYFHLKVLKEQSSMKKLKHLKNTKLRYMQKYLSQVSLENARLEFRYNVRMLDTKSEMGK